jgi:hypothetical protein
MAITISNLAILVTQRRPAQVYPAHPNSPQPRVNMMNHQSHPFVRPESYLDKDKDVASGSCARHLAKSLVCISLLLVSAATVADNAETVADASSAAAKNLRRRAPSAGAGGCAGLGCSMVWAAADRPRAQP